MYLTVYGSCRSVSLLSWSKCSPDRNLVKESNLTDLLILRLSVTTPNVYVKPKRDQYIRNPVRQKVQQFKRFVENYRRHIMSFVVVYGVTAGVIIERCYCERNSSSLVHGSELFRILTLLLDVFRLRRAGGGHRYA